MKDFRYLSKLKKTLPFIVLALVVFCCILVFINLLLKSASTGKATIFFNPSFSKAIPDQAILRQLELIDISAKGAIIMDDASQKVIFGKNIHLRFSPASTAKIMTALTALSFFKLNDILTIKQAMSEGSVLGLVKGERMTFRNLLYALLLPSANDAALAIAQNYPGGEKGFISAMNKNAAKFDLKSTHYGDPAGLLDDLDYTTPLDLARLSSIALLNPTFSRIVDTRKITITDISRKYSYPLSNLNILLGVDGIDGIKTGYTKQAKQVLVTSLVKKENGINHTIIIVVMDSNNRFSDTLDLLNIVNKINYLSKKG